MNRPLKNRTRATPATGKDGFKGGAKPNGVTRESGLDRKGTSPITQAMTPSGKAMVLDSPAD